MRNFSKKLSKTKVGIITQALFAYAEALEVRFNNFPPEIDQDYFELIQLRTSLSFKLLQEYREKEVRNQANFKCNHPIYEAVILKNALLEYLEKIPRETEFANIADSLKNELHQLITNTTNTSLVKS